MAGVGDEDATRIDRRPHAPCGIEPEREAGPDARADVEAIEQVLGARIGDVGRDAVAGERRRQVGREASGAKRVEAHPDASAGAGERSIDGGSARLTIDIGAEVVEPDDGPEHRRPQVPEVHVERRAEACLRILGEGGPGAHLEAAKSEETLRGELCGAEQERATHREGEQSKKGT